MNRPGEVFGVESVAKRTSMPPFAVDGREDREGAACRRQRCQQLGPIDEGPIIRRRPSPLSPPVSVMQIAGVRVHTESGFGSARKRCTMYLYLKMYVAENAIQKVHFCSRQSTSIGGNSHAVAI